MKEIIITPNDIDKEQNIGNGVLENFFDMNQRKYEALEKYMFELKERIDKAIEHIDNCKKYRKTPYTMQEKILLEILKGDSNESNKN